MRVVLWFGCERAEGHSRTTGDELRLEAPEVGDGEHTVRVAVRVRVARDELGLEAAEVRDGEGAVEIAVRLAPAAGAPPEPALERVRAAGHPARVRLADRAPDGVRTAGGE